MYLHEAGPGRDPGMSLQLETLRLGARRLHVVRDDLLPAGTKQRAVVPLLFGLRAQGYRRFTYASPFAGFAQVALAHGCRELGVECALFCEKDPKRPGLHPHAFTELAQSFGAKVVLAGNLEQAEEMASEDAEEGTKKIPLGFQCSEFHHYFRQALAVSLAKIKAQLGSLPARAWLPVGSGTLARAFRAEAPPSMQLNCVDVRVLPASDERLVKLGSLPNLRLLRAPEKFSEEAYVAPPLPSNIHYDAKLWAFLEREADDGDLWWNVAR